MYEIAIILVTAIVVGGYLIVVIPKGLGNTFGNILMGTNTPPPKTSWKEFFCEDWLLLFNDTTEQTSGYWHRRMCEREERWDKRVNQLKKFFHLK